MTHKPVTNHPQPVLNSNLQARNAKLLVLYKQWQGTPYRLGGNSTKGIDCSAFVQQVYLAGFDIKLPRTTKSQSSFGQAVKQHGVIGDLIFFRTNARTRHVGIYINNNQFLHASTSKGVIISELNNIYWRKHYWQTRRVLPESH
ncbi:NlpC/P60 family protein [Colwellia piezophila]|uniref:NlpC/P60 family protein n=1 Tax=Colwellia piezophila TaxID=211668 RepID=UPI001FE174F5|nr:NlpC/P60 family protein [Colwellia piezophila]